jgi:Fur family ferric uptake transcriptional regulator
MSGRPLSLGGPSGPAPGRATGLRRARAGAVAGAGAGARKGLTSPSRTAQSRSVGPTGSEKHSERKKTNEPERIWRAFVSRRKLNASKARDAVVDIFLGTKDHIDLQALYALARKHHPGVGFATVYRTMKLLEEAGVAHARHFGDARETLYEVAAGRSHHDHLICEHCGQIVEFVNPEVERLQDQIAARHGFELSRHRHELYGRCRDCRAATAP